jgi:class 3 adenylate cyclase/TolB-like protein
MLGGDAKMKAPDAWLLASPEPDQVGPGLGSGRIVRRLAAFLALDIRDYSVMMSRDEAVAHKRVGKDLAIVVRQIHKRGGRVLQFSGDGLLAEFSSPRAALQSALHIQSAAGARNRRRSVEQRIEYRIGINAGEFVVQGNRVGGDTVNIAARLEQIAEPGAICMSEAVFAQVRGHVKAVYTNIGAVRLKNIRYPIVTYRVSLERGKGGREAAADYIAASSPETEDYRPSIAILPLDNVGDDPAADYFSDGVVEDIIVSLAGLRELRVISRASTLSYRGRTDVREVGRALGVRYVLSGSIRRSERAIRASVELTDARTGFSLWGDVREFSTGRAL